jgi:putative addiction module component (TIGR02574 family)
MSSATLDEVLRLPLPERIEFVQAVWDSVVAEASAVPVTSAQRAELDRRLASLEERPGAERPWSEVLSGLERSR